MQVLGIVWFWVGFLIFSLQLLWVFFEVFLGVFLGGGLVFLVFFVLFWVFCGFVCFWFFGVVVFFEIQVSLKPLFTTEKRGKVRNSFHLKISDDQSLISSNLGSLNIIFQFRIATALKKLNNQHAAFSFQHLRSMFSRASAESR